MKVEVVTLFPEMISGALRYGVLGRAIDRGILAVGLEDPRSHTQDVHRTVDDRPYGGGPGMVLKAAPMLAAIRAARARLPVGSPAVYLSPQGEPFTQAAAKSLAAGPGLLLVAGRYEGLDERVIELAIDREYSIGDYVLSGGELPALVVIDALARLLPGALGDERSSVDETFAQGLLEGPQYTRPPVFEGHEVPSVLLSGDHAAIRRWRLQQAVGRTLARRPELLAGTEPTGEAGEVLRELAAAQCAQRADRG